jgi:hypothetical protein
MNALQEASPEVLLYKALKPLRSARRLLLDPTPRNVDLCAGRLLEAVRRVESALAAGGQGSDWGNSREATLEFRDELTVTAALLERAAGFHRNFARPLAHNLGRESAGRLQIDA